MRINYLLSRRQKWWKIDIAANRVEFSKPPCTRKVRGGKSSRKKNKNERRSCDCYFLFSKFNIVVGKTTAVPRKLFSKQTAGDTKKEKKKTARRWIHSNKNNVWAIKIETQQIRAGIMYYCHLLVAAIDIEINVGTAYRRLRRWYFQRMI